MNSEITIFLLSLLITLLRISARGINYYFLKTELENTTGLYFEPLNQIKIIGEDYHLISDLNIREVPEISTTLLDTYSNVLLHCENLEESNFCVKVAYDYKFENQRQNDNAN